MAGAGVAAIAALDVVGRELALFACVGFLIGGLDDLLVDAIYFARRRSAVPVVDTNAAQLPLAVFIPAWDEAAVISAMLRSALSRFDYDVYRLYVGAYPNDPATLAAIAQVAETDARVRLVVNALPGPTTKGDNLNAMWRALRRDEAADGWRAAAVVLHDAEDVVGPMELRVFASLLDRYASIQLPVVPLIARDSRWVSAHYADEFAIMHDRNLVVRQALGAGLPLAGVGCALRRDVLEAIAAARGGQPFDPTSLVEDYELGLGVAAIGGRGCFARVTDRAGQLVCVRSYFPSAIAASVRQKARWMAGIALLGWDRLGWARWSQLGEHWMRMRDRRGVLAIVVLATGYAAMLCGAGSATLHYVSALPPGSASPLLAAALGLNSLLLTWRAGCRAVATGRIYGWREGLRAIPRIVVGNFIALLAARRAVAIYWGTLHGRTARWDKTTHVFPETL